MPEPSESIKTILMFRDAQSSVINLNDQLIDKVSSELKDTNNKIHTQRRRVFYDFETDMFENAKLFFLGNVLFICLITIIVFISYRYFT